MCRTFENTNIEWLIQNYKKLGSSFQSLVFANQIIMRLNDLQCLILARDLVEQLIVRLEIWVSSRCWMEPCDVSPCYWWNIWTDQARHSWNTTQSWHSTWSHFPLHYSRQMTKPRIQSKSRTKRVRTSSKSKPSFWWRSPGSLKCPRVSGHHWLMAVAPRWRFFSGVWWRYVRNNRSLSPSWRHRAKELWGLRRLVYWLRLAIFRRNSKLRLLRPLTSKTSGCSWRNHCIRRKRRPHITSTYNDRTH